MLKVVGIDPGLANTGIGLIQGNGLTITKYSFGNIKTDKKDPICLRLNIIYTKIKGFLYEQKPDIVVIEDIFSLGKYPITSITLGKVSGVLILAAFKAGAKVNEIPVRQAKKIVSGSGTADKYQVEKTIRNILNHPEKIKPFHASDALALALCEYYRSS
ncbi:MAG: crossover junction endodeoxyribonuclease [Desulfobacteraceae bacterium 4572_130]|nr:MAG: crossover junction endodeoxyribonuclease [Desulfobacteraceae bacterium 4572_130]